MKRRLILLSALLAIAGFTVKLQAATPQQGSCAGIAKLQLPDTTIEFAQEIAGPSFTPPDSEAFVNLPAFCRVVAVTAPSIRFEVWLPLVSWNGKFEGVGNGGLAGVISDRAMAGALRRGYATASTDTGHINGPAGAAWAIERPDLIADFGYRGLHLTTVNGKDITRAFYGKAAKYSYYYGCSKGGQQGLMEAQRFPEDYDGIVAGDPANNWTRFYAGGHLWFSIATLKDRESYIPQEKIPFLANAVNAACDAKDGIVDGVLNDPRTCKFDPAVLQCKEGEDPKTCFTEKQVQTIKDIWSGPRNSSGELIHPGLMPGGEAGPDGWASWISGTERFSSNHWYAASSFFKDMVFENPFWDFRTFDYDNDMAFALAKVGGDLDAVEPNLESFRRRGAKLIVYHGWSDPDISPLNTINYYESVVSLSQGLQNREAALEKTQKFFRLFMVPGMQHCSGGPGPNTFDMLTALENWVEKGKAPKQVLASHLTEGVPDRTRPLCVYPQVAVYTGKGSTDDAANFVCRAGR